MRGTWIAGGAVWLLPLMLFCQLPNQTGWPVDIYGYKASPINIADIDDDGNTELVFGDGAWWLYVKKADGTDAAGWPINLAGSENTPALFDSNDDGKLEIVKTYSGLQMWNSDASLAWSLPYSGPPFNSTYLPYNVSVEDIDNDGNKEIVLTCYSGGAIFVFDAQGNVRPGWPVLAPISGFQSASIGDIDGDGLKEIVHTSASIWCFKPDGSYCPGFPVDFLSSSRSKPVLADIDGDGFLEIIFGWEDAKTRILKYDGTLFPGYPINYLARGISYGDMNADGFFDFFFSRPMLFGVQGFDALSATMLTNFPLTDPSGQFGFSAAAPNLCDLSDDPGLEIASGAANISFVPDGKHFAFNLSGNVLPDFPSTSLFHRALTAGCVVNDLDGDGDIEICCGSENYEAAPSPPSTVYCWDSPHPYNLDSIDWAMDGFDLGHTGRWRKLYHINKAGSQLAVGGCQPTNPCYLPPDGSLIAVDVTAVREHGGANPAGQDVRYSRTLGCGNYEGPVIDHGDGTYTRMLRAPLANCATDVHAWVNEFKLQDYQQIVFTAGCVAPPPPFSLLNPPDGAVQQPLNVTLEWPAVGTFPNQASSYDLYFGITPDPPSYQSGLTTPYFDLHSLALGTTYYWRVEARNACGATSSPVWSFTTACPVPEPFVNLCPADVATDLPLDVELAWEPSAHAAGYEVYLGTDPSLLSFVSTSTEPRATIKDLALGETYYWQIAAQNACGETPGAVWSFTTGTGGECHHCRPVSPP